MSVCSARSLEVCNSRGFQFVAKLARICHSCSHPFALATRQNLKKSHHLREQKIARVAAALLVLLRDYSNSFNLYNVAELSTNRTAGNGVQVETEIKKITVMCSRSPQSLEFSHFTLWFGRARWRNVPNSKRTCRAFVFLIISYCFVTLSLPSP